MAGVLPTAASIGQVGLVEEISGALVSFVIGGKGHGRAASAVTRAGHVVLIEAVVVAEDRAMSNGQPADPVLKRCQSQIWTFALHVDLSAGFPIVGFNRHIGRPALEREVEGPRSAVAGVAEIFVAERKLRLLVGAQAWRWIERVAFSAPNRMPEAGRNSS